MSVDEMRERVRVQAEQIAALQATLGAIGREAERASDVRRNRTQLLGNIHLLVQEALALAEGCAAPAPEEPE